jgi:RNA polymerase sigma-70 factor (ECF subfamily)
MTSEAPWQDAIHAAIEGCDGVALDDAVAHVDAAIAAGASPARAADLALAFAVASGDPVAARRFDDHIGGELATAVRAVDRDPVFVDEICQRTRVRLVVGDGGAPRIASYRGAGPLRAWAAIVAQRAALRAKRSTIPERAPAAALADLIDREPDPELRRLRGRYRAELGDALAGALAGLADRARAVLRLRLVDGLELAEIGRLYRVHESTAARWITVATDDVATATRSRLATDAVVASEAAEAVARMVHSQLELGIARLLA